MESKNRKNIRITSEILVLSLVIFFLNYLYFSKKVESFVDPFNLYMGLALIVSAYYGKIFGLLSFSFIVILIMIPVKNDIVLIDFWKELWRTESIRIAVLLVGVYLFGMIRDSYLSKIRHYQILAKKEAFEKFKYQKEAKALTSVNNELEERVLRQHESVSSLYTQIKALHTQSLTDTLNILLNTVNKFTWADKASIWRFDSNMNQLVMIANIGWEAEDFVNSILGIEETIEGWCFRNNLHFSVRMLLEYDNLRKMDNKRNIFTFPINFSNSSWGILNIEDMPFTKYNLYVENILSILVDLASPEIERAAEYESNITQKEVNKFTHLPSYRQFYSVIQNNIVKAVNTNKTFSIVVLEVINFSDFTNEFGEEKSYKLLMLLLEKLNVLSKNKIDFYHFKEENQIAIYFPDLDYDGISLFCLETLGIINNNSWSINDKTLVLDTILGYSSLGHQQITVDELFSVAENLLEMQKV